MNYQIVFARNAHHTLEALAASEYDVIQIDWAMDPVEARSRVGTKTLQVCFKFSFHGFQIDSFQGNLDPAVLFASPEAIRAEVKEMLECLIKYLSRILSYKTKLAFGTSRYIANLGHGMLPSHDPEHLRVFIDSVHELSTTGSA